MSIGWDVLLVGRLLPGSLPLTRSYGVHRMRLLFKSGALFYAEYNLRLFWLLLFSKADVFHPNDLDTLLANGLAAKLRRKKLVYDSHEYFTGTPEIQDRPLVKRTWEIIEGWFFAQPLAVFTVNDSIARLFSEQYRRKLHVMRNIPESQQAIPIKTRTELGLPTDKFIMVLQGSGINAHRGSEEMLQTLALLDDSFLWLIVGSGDVVPFLKTEAGKLGLMERVRFLPKMPYLEMMQYTKAADLGLTLDKPTNINYLYSLPNKIFDYIRAGIPVFASNLPEVANIIRTYEVGFVFHKHDPVLLAEQLQSIKSNSTAYQQAKENTQGAAAGLSWEEEVKVLLEVYRRLASEPISQ